MIVQKIKETIRDIPDFPKKGIIFKDITPVLEDPELSKSVNRAFVDEFKQDSVDAVIGIESRGFFFGMMIAQALGVPFIPVRKEGKLPDKTISCSFELEYGEATVEMHHDALKPGYNVLIHDDLLATGGTADAAAQLVKQQKAKVMGFAFLISLDFLKGKEKLTKYSDKIFSLVHYKE